MSPNQKGFLPHDGVFENNFVVDYRFGKSKLRRKDICLASLDISNAFGILPHWAIFNALQSTGVGGDFLDIFRDCYDNSVTTFKTSRGSSEPTLVSSGVRQGDPLSGLLFIITIDFILNRLQKHSEELNVQCDRNHYVLAYADDVVVSEKSTDATSPS